MSRFTRRHSPLADPLESRQHLSAAIFQNAMVSTGKSPSQVLAVDFNHDGRPDLATTDYETDEISVFLASADGSFAFGASYATGDDPESVVAGDFDHDGTPDLAVPSFLAGTVSVLFGNGDGTFTSATAFSSGRFPIAMTSADVNADGLADLVIGNEIVDAGNITVLIARPGRTFAPPVQYLAGTTDDLVFGVAAADFNRDGRMDLAATSSIALACKVTILLGTAGGGFIASTSYPIEDTGLAVATGDLNADGFVDLLYSAGGVAPKVCVMLGGPGGTFAPKIGDNQLLFGSITSISVGDVTGDGKADVVASQGSDYLTVLAGDGTGHLGTYAPHAVGSYPGQPMLADMNGDGLLDLVAANRASKNVSILINRGGGIFEQNYSVGTWEALADVDHDGKIDLLSVSSTRLYVRRGMGDGTFGGEVSYASTMTLYALSTADLNGDGWVDAIATQGSSDTRLAIFMGQPGGTFAAATYVSAPQQQSARGVSVSGDFNGDGKTDLATTNAGAAKVVVLLGRGDGTFLAPVAYAVGLLPKALSVADVDGDGRLDLITASSVVATVSVLRGQAGGTFATAKDYATGAVPLAVAVGDINNDGRPDVLTANPNDYSVSVLLGTGGSIASGAAFGAATKLTGFLDPRGITLGDFDGDHRPDLVVSNPETNSLSLRLGLGDGTFAAATEYGVGIGPQLVNISDLNGDGRPDLISADFIAATATVLLNRSQSDFVPPTVTASAWSADASGPGVRFTLSEPIDAASLQPGDLVITSLNDPLAVLSATSAVVSSDGRGLSFRLPVLADGNYRFVLRANSVADLAGNPLAQEATVAAAESFVLAGDVNRDRHVDFNDLVILAQNYGMAGRLFGQGDLNADGVVDFNDLVILAQGYGKSVEAPQLFISRIAACGRRG